MQSIAYTLTYDNVLVIKYFCTTTDVWRTYTRTVICRTLTQHFFVKLWNEDRNPPFAAVVPSLLGFIEKICNDFIKFFTLKENANVLCVKEVLLEPCLYYWKFWRLVIFTGISFLVLCYYFCSPLCCHSFILCSL